MKIIEFTLDDLISNQIILTAYGTQYLLNTTDIDNSEETTSENKPLTVNITSHFVIIE